MCLDTVYRGKQKREALAKLPESGYYWKAVLTEKGKYRPTANRNKYIFEPGWNIDSKHTFEEDYLDYPVGFHLYRQKSCIIHWAKYFGWALSVKYIRCKVEKKDILAIGQQQNGLCIVTTRFWCPKPTSSRG